MRKGRSRIISLTGIDPNRPLRDQLTAHLRQLILTGAIGAGARLPAQRALAKELKLSRNTIIHAYETLTSEGLLAGKKGAGTYVAQTIAPPQSKRRLPADTSATFLPLAQGLPDLSLFPIKDWQRTQNRRWRTLKAESLGYGDPAGWSGLRHILAQRTAAVRGVSCSAEQIHIVPSTVAGVRLVGVALKLGGQTALVEALGYVRAREALIASGATLVAFPVDDSGADIGAGLTAAPYARLAHVTPAAQFPTGAVLSRARRRALVQWANAGNGWILEEDYESDFAFDGAAASPMAAEPRAQKVIYLSTLNNVMFPSLRLSFLILPDALIDPFAAARRSIDAASDIPRQMVMEDFMEAGYLAAHLRRCKEVYAERRQILRGLLEARLPGLVRLAPQPVGLHVAAWLRPGSSDITLEQSAKEQNLTIHAFGNASLVANSVAPGFYAGFAAYAPAVIERAIDRLAPLVRATA